MSLWGATVITNLLSAIPWIGQDIVESIEIDNISNASSINISIAYITLISKTGLTLPKIGELSDKSRVNLQKYLTVEDYLNIPDKFISFLVGFIDGDGYIGINKTGKNYVKISLAISIHLDDLSLLKYIQSVLKIGTIYTDFDKRSPMCRLVFNRSELQLVLFPLLKHHNIYFLTKNRRYQYNLAMEVFLQNIKYYNDLPKHSDIYNDLPIESKDYLNLKFFNDWVVGFVEAEGSFLIKANKDGCFQIKQKLHHALFDAFILLFETSRKITIDKGLYLQLSVSSKKDIQNVINFFSFSGHHPLIGLKYISYLKWLNNLKLSERYQNLKFPI